MIPAAGDADFLKMNLQHFRNNQFSFTTERTHLVEPPKMLITFFYTFIIPPQQDVNPYICDELVSFPIFSG